MGHRIVENEQTEREHSDRWFCSINVRFGSKADICSAPAHVRFTPESGRVRRNQGCPLWAKSGLLHRSKRDLYSITSSARDSSACGTVRPSALAVFWLMYSSTLVACWTGRSAGLSPLRTRPV